MSTLAELASQIYGDDTQKLIAAENPYVVMQKAPNDVTNTLAELVKPQITTSGEVLSPKYSVQDVLPWALGSSLVSGILQGFGGDYQNDLTDRYMTVVGGGNADLPSALFGSAKRQGNLFSTLRGLELQGLQDQIDKSGELYDMQLGKQLKYADQAAKNKMLQSFGDMAIKNPSRAAKALPYLQQSMPGLFGNGSTPMATAAGQEQLPAGVGGNAGEYTGPTRSAEPMQSQGVGGVEGALLDDVSTAAQELMDQGAEPAQAFTTAREMMKTKRDELDRQYKRIEEAEKAGADAKTLAQQMQVALQGAGDTGAFGNLKQFASGWLGLANEGQHKKYAAGQDVETFSNEAVKQFGRAFKGPMSDRDVAIMLRAAPSLGTEEETNQKILDRWNFAAELQLTYADFMRTKQSQGVPVSQAEAEWSKIRKQNPYVIKKGDDWVINSDWLTGELNLTGKSQHGASGSWDDASEASPTSTRGVPSVGGNFNGQPVVRVTKKR